MNLFTLPWRRAADASSRAHSGVKFGVPSDPLDGPHLQRLAERWLRRWGYALSGLVLGLCLMWLAHPEASDQHASAEQAVAQLQRQLADLSNAAPAQAPASTHAKTDKAMADAQRLLSSLPAWSRPEQVWADWQQALAAQGLRLQFLQPMPTSSPDVRSGALVSHVAAWRVLGRFDDWSRVWAACAESGPVCALERISVVATDTPGEVQIDAVMRVWMRPAEGPGAGGVDEGSLSSSVHAAQPGGLADALMDIPPTGRSRVALFAPSRGLAEGATGGEAGLRSGDSDGAVPSGRADGASAAVASLAMLPDDPHQWPLARLRLAGLWQQGGTRQAVLSADTHWARVSVGQRVTLEGHRVVTITDEGVGLRLGQGPVLQLTWADARQAAGSVGPTPKGNTTGSRSK